MYTSKVSNKLGGFEGSFGANPFVTAWRYYTGQPAETQEEFAERARREGLVAGEKEQARLAAAAQQREVEAAAERERARLREEAIAKRDEALATERAETSRNKKIAIIAGAVALVGGVWWFVIKQKGASNRAIF